MTAESGPTPSRALERVRTDADARLAVVLAAVFAFSFGFVLGFLLRDRPEPRSPSAAELDHDLLATPRPEGLATDPVPDA